jgi:hypothetical protein
MNNRIQTSWQVFRASLNVMKQNPLLLAFPALIAVFTLGITLFFAAPIALQPTGHSYLEAAHWKAVESSLLTDDSMRSLSDSTQRHSSIRLKGHASAYLMIIYFASMFCATFFNVAFCSQIFKALDGKPVSIAEGLRYAMNRWKPIVFWSLLAGLVGLLIRKLEQRFGFVGKIVVNLVGLAWSVASVFAIPVIVRETAVTNPMEVLTLSASAIKKTWGEALLGWLGIQFGGFLALLGSISILVAGGVLTFWLSSPWPIIIAAVCWVAGLMIFAYLSSVAELIYQCSLYLYASTGLVPPPYDRPMMDIAWKTK